MRYIKTYEEKYELGAITKREEKLNKVAHYFEMTIPVLKQEGFKECLYSNDEDTNPIFTFYFSLYVDEDVYEKFYTYLKEIDLYKRIVDEHTSGNQYLGAFEIDVKLTEYMIKKFADKYDLLKAAKDYNL